MLGHQLVASWRHRHDVRVTLRQELARYTPYRMFTRSNAYDQVDVRDTKRVTEVFTDFRPEAVVNAAGIIKQREESRAAVPTLEVNALFPHRLRELCQWAGARLAHISTDCVFSGNGGNYRESDPCDVHDLYGLSKYLGEVREAPAVTLRTSIIGLELAGKKSLIEWFLAQQGDIRGFTRAIYTGVTTLELARVIERVLLDHRHLTGLWHVASKPISKYELLSKLAAMLGRSDVRITPSDDECCDRSLNGRAFAQRTGYQAPPWESMLAELAGQIQAKGVRHHAA
jgi:dTDP-4-dehydrorhamnose reductase